MEEKAGQHLSSGLTLTSSLQSTTSNSGDSEAVQEQLTVTEHHSGAEGIPGTAKPLLSGLLTNTQYSEDVGMVLCIFTLTSRSLFVLLFGMPFLHRFSFIIIFLSCFCTFFYIFSTMF